MFESGDIAKDIPNEHKKFMMTDRMWKDLMNNVDNFPNVKNNCVKEGLLEKLKEANMNLENVEKGLNDYMEKKRAIFPRFYFISNAQFLEILSQTKDIKKVKYWHKYAKPMLIESWNSTRPYNCVVGAYNVT